MIFNTKSIIDRLNKDISNTPFGQNPDELYEPVRYFMSLGGKRLRPLLTVFGTYLFNDEFEKAFKPALAVEIFHNFTLMHDDIMDNAPLRRNQATVHEKWNANVAILAGDVMLLKAYDFLLESDPELYAKILPAFNLCGAEVCEGQQLDMNFENSSNISESDYLEMIRLKTAVLLGFALELGARLGGAPEKDIQLLKQTGEYMGIAFQLKDDLLDVFGDQEKFGKQVGGDIVANKKTYLLLRAMEKANKEDKLLLSKHLTDSTISAEYKVKAVSAIYTKLSIKEDTEEMINGFIDKAMQSLSKVESSFYKKAQLRKYFMQLADREN